MTEQVEQGQRQVKMQLLRERQQMRRLVQQRAGEVMLLVALDLPGLRRDA